MNIFPKLGLGIFVIFHLIIHPVYADGLGRLFSSEDERKQLDYIRNHKPVEKIKIKPVEIETIIEPVQEEIIVRDAIILKGIVYRGDGKSTAWINESNTFEGDLESQYIQVPEEEISQDKIKIIMPDDETHVELKVGETFIPSNGE